jgi:hypothetical protein
MLWSLRRLLRVVPEAQHHYLVVTCEASRVAVELSTEGHADVASFDGCQAQHAALVSPGRAVIDDNEPTRSAGRARNVCGVEIGMHLRLHWLM